MLLCKRLELIADLIDKRMLNFNKQQRQWLYTPPMCNQSLHSMLQMLKVMCFWINKSAAKLSQIRLSLAV